MNNEIRPDEDKTLSLVAFWMEMWMMPITMTARFMGLGRTALADPPEIDRDGADCQLPVPSKHQQDMDRDLHA